MKTSRDRTWLRPAWACCCFGSSNVRSIKANSVALKMFVSFFFSVVLSAVCGRMLLFLGNVGGERSPTFVTEVIAALNRAEYPLMTDYTGNIQYARTTSFADTTAHSNLASQQAQLALRSAHANATDAFGGTVGGYHYVSSGSTNALAQGATGNTGNGADGNSQLGLSDATEAHGRVFLPGAQRFGIVFNGFGWFETTGSGSGHGRGAAAELAGAGGTPLQQGGSSIFRRSGNGIALHFTFKFAARWPSSSSSGAKSTGNCDDGTGQPEQVLAEVLAPAASSGARGGPRLRSRLQVVLKRDPVSDELAYAVLRYSSAGVQAGSGDWTASVAGSSVSAADGRNGQQRQCAVTDTNWDLEVAAMDAPLQASVISPSGRGRGGLVGNDGDEGIGSGTTWYSLSISLGPQEATFHVVRDPWSAELHGLRGDNPSASSVTRAPTGTAPFGTLSASGQSPHFSSRSLPTTQLG